MRASHDDAVLECVIHEAISRKPKAESRKPKILSLTVTATVQRTLQGLLELFVRMARALLLEDGRMQTAAILRPVKTAGKQSISPSIYALGLILTGRIIVESCY